MKTQLLTFLQNSSLVKASWVFGWGASILPLGCLPDQTPLPEDEVEARGIVVHLGDKRQTMRGFGASSAWTAPVLSDGQADALFSVDSGIGLSLLRIQIKPDGTSSELGAVDAAVERGAQVWAAPWSPRGEWKSNGSTNNGGSLLPEHYEDWAQSLADFAQLMNDRGTPLLGISAQNEPDYTAEWDTCRYEPEELATFVGDYLAPALAELEDPVPVIAPEAANWGSIERFGTALLDYEPAAESILAYATHGYGGIEPWHFERLTESGGELWMTEVSDEFMSEPDVGMGSALRVAEMIHADIVVGQVSAWHYWWLLPRGDVDDTNAALFDRNYEITKRAYALGHYSRFVRPGFVRVETVSATAEERPMSAYVSPSEDQLVLVLANESSLSADQEVSVPDASVDVIETFLTDETRSLEEVSVVSTTTDGVLVELPPRSMVTVVLSLD